MNRDMKLRKEKKTRGKKPIQKMRVKLSTFSENLTKTMGATYGCD